MFQRIINVLLTVLFTFYFLICYSKGEPESTQLAIPEVTSDVEPLPESFLTEPLNLATGIDFSLCTNIKLFPVLKIEIMIIIIIYKIK